MTEPRGSEPGQQCATGSYSYPQRRGMLDVSWNLFHGLCKGLALAAAEVRPEVVVGLARGGPYPAMQLAHLLRTDIQMVRLTRRVADRVVTADPVWSARPAAGLACRRVLVVDELVLNPWDREILVDGAFVPHPEYLAARSAQGGAADLPLLAISPVPPSRIPPPPDRIAFSTSQNP